MRIVMLMMMMMMTAEHGTKSVTLTQRHKRKQTTMIILDGAKRYAKNKRNIGAAFIRKQKPISMFSPLAGAFFCLRFVSRLRQ